jgi:16S rRNA (guanine(966)-N(2))-methyltransferase RsmD
MDTRPTSDRLRETLFNVLGPRVEGARFVDLYAGSGAVGLEALSRGAEFVWFAEKAAGAVAAIRANVTALKVEARCVVETRGAARVLESLAKAEEQVDVVFLDPPYEAEKEYLSTLEFLGREGAGVLAAGAVVVAEHAKRRSFGERFGELQRVRLLQQGDAALSFYELR